MGKKEKVTEQPKDKFDGLQLELKDIKTAILNLSSEEDEVLTATCNACFSFLIKDRYSNSLIVLELGAVERLMKLIISTEKNVRRSSLMVLGLISGVNQVCQVLAKKQKDIVADCTALLQDEDPLVVEFSINILANLSAMFQIGEEIIENNSVPLIIKLLSSSDPDTKKHALVCLFSLANDFEIRLLLTELEAVNYVIDLIMSDYPVIQQHALNLCSALCVEANSCDQLISNDGLNKLLTFIENKEFMEIHTNALETLSRCLSSAGALVQFNENGGFARLISAINTNIETQLGEQCGIQFAEFIYQLDEVPKVFIENGTAEFLHKMISNPNHQTKISACKAARMLAKESLFRDQAADMGITLKIVQLLQSERQNVCREAILTLSQLIQNHETNMGIISSNSVMERAVSLLSDDDHDLLYGALTVLTIMAKDEATTSEANKDILIEQLEKLAKKDSPKIQNSMMEVVTCYIISEKDRKNLIKSNLVDAIILLLASKVSSVRSSACHTVMAIARDELTAKVLVDKGCIDVLQLVLQSAHMKSHIANATLNQLLDYDLSAKYSLKRKLYQANHIKDGFYDGGIIDPQSKFKPLSCQLRLNINEKQPVLVVNVPDSVLHDELRVELTATNMESIKYSSEDQIDSRKIGKNKRNPREGTRSAASGERQSCKISKNMNNFQTEHTDDKNDSVEDKQCYDNALMEIITSCADLLSNKQTIQGQLKIISECVSDFFGGKVIKSKMCEFGYEIGIVELKREKNSNVLPLGSINKGLYRERALLFKLLCDHIGIPVTLEQGTYGRAWNSIILDEKECLIDLITSPGEIYLLGHPSSFDYITL